MLTSKIYLLFCIITGAKIHVNDAKQMTGLFGNPIGHKTDLLTAGNHGPALLQDVQFQEEMAHFDRERIPERVVHAHGTGAFGVFRVTNTEITKYTKADLFNKPRKQTEVAVRFSTVSGEKGSADTSFGEPRGFAVKFYTEEGNWDLTGLSAPMFFIRDASQFPSLIHATKRNVTSGLPEPNYRFDFFSLRPETLNMQTYVYSDNGMPDGYRNMPGFGVHAFRLVNKQNKHVFAKFHWITKQGNKNLDRETTFKLAGSDPDYAQRDLYTAISNRQYPSWTLKIQVITDDMIKDFKFNPFDATKIWPIDKYPLIEVGVMTLNRIPRNFFAEVEQLAFCPSNLVPGIEPSPDLLLAGRLFSYKDTQRYRLGANNQLIPVNHPKNQINTLTDRDGFMRTDNNEADAVNYYPNSFSSVRDNPKKRDSNITLKADSNDEIVVFRFDDSDDHNYEQARDYYRSLADDWKTRLHQNLAFHMKTIRQFIIDRQLNQLRLVDPAFADGVKQELNNFRK